MSFRPEPADSFPSIYAADARSGGTGEQRLADAIARMGATDARLPGIFLPEGPDFGAAWRSWLRETFESWLGAVFCGAYAAAGQFRVEQLMNLDAVLESRLDSPARERSRAAAAAWLEGRIEMRRQPQWAKYIGLWTAGETAGHLPVAFALQAALFQVPLLPALVSYATFEGVNGLAAYGGGRLDPGRFSEKYPEGTMAARTVFRAAGLGDFAAAV
jgi:hypothetical protein